MDDLVHLLFGQNPHRRLSLLQMTVGVAYDAKSRGHDSSTVGRLPL
jgi:hypothetical protein